MRNTHKILLIATLAVSTLTLQAKGISFAGFDTNNDNSLTEKEYYDARDKRIGERAKEGRKMKGLANMASFADIDSNADGKVSQSEFVTFIAEHKKKGH